MTLIYKEVSPRKRYEKVKDLGMHKSDSKHILVCVRNGVSIYFDRSYKLVKSK